MVPRTPSKTAEPAPVAKYNRFRQGPVTIGNITGRLTRPALGKRGFAGAEILTHWPNIVGPELAAFACPLQVKYPKGRNAGATLHLRVSHGAAAAMLQMKLPAVMERINRFFGYEAISKIEAAQGPLPPRPKAPAPLPPLSETALAAVESRISGVSPGPLRDALMKLGKTLQQRGR